MANYPMDVTYNTYICLLHALVLRRLQREDQGRPSKVQSWGISSHLDLVLTFITADHAMADFYDTYVELSRTSIYLFCGWDLSLEDQLQPSKC